MKNIFVLKEPMTYTDPDGSNPRDEWWGKFLKYRHRDFMGGDDFLFSPVFSSLWPGLWITMDKVRRPNALEWIEYGLKMIRSRLGVFWHYIKLAFKSLYN